MRLAQYSRKFIFFSIAIAMTVSSLFIFSAPSEAGESLYVVYGHKPGWKTVRRYCVNQPAIKLHKEQWEREGLTVHWVKSKNQFDCKSASSAINAYFHQHGTIPAWEGQTR